MKRQFPALTPRVFCDPCQFSFWEMEMLGPTGGLELRKRKECPWCCGPLRRMRAKDRKRKP